MAMGRSEEEAHCSVRFSLSLNTTEHDIDRAVTMYNKVLDEAENTVRFLPCK
jgi:cysteine sulfinate desulfinase/cysteine desulfurase-like protein